jgi:tRNA isopentenyl-2-thiomethyl-A-37 hydroxylase MiaE
MAKDTKIGKNRTGLQMSPTDAKELLEGSQRAMPTSEGDEGALAALRAPYIKDSDGLGSVPPPGSAKGVLKSGVQMITGNRPEVFIDKLAERLAFERGGTRLYEALMIKCLAGADENSVIDRMQLEEIHSEEMHHFELVRQALESLGADPTAMTPCANLAGVEAMGLVQVLNDPRTTIAQSVHAILIAELADNAGWELLITLADEHGHKKLSEQFAGALVAEQRHLAQVKAWMRELTLDEARMLTA